MKNTFQVITYILFAFVMIGGLAISYFQYIDGVFNPPIVFMADQLALKTDKAAYHRGDEISIFNSLCKNREYTSKTTWRIVDDIVITFPDQGSRIASVECVTNRQFLIGKIPPFASIGKNHLEATTALTLNPLKTIYLNFRTVDFEVIK